MSRQGLAAAYVHGEGLPAFSTLALAEESLSLYKDETLAAFANELSPKGSLSFSPSSLKEIEAWYFNASFPEIGKGGYLVPHAIGFYFGEVLCRNAGFAWVVKAFTFKPGHYEIGVTRARTTIMLTKGKRLTLERNTRKNSLFRGYNSYAP